MQFKTFHVYLQNTVFCVECEVLLNFFLLIMDSCDSVVTLLLAYLYLILSPRILNDQSWVLFLKFSGKFLR